MKKILAFIGTITVAGAMWYSFTVKADEFYFAALGDSGTTAFNAQKSWNNIENSWATGTKIKSHFVMLKEKLTGKRIRVINMAVPGVAVDDIIRQAEQASSIPLDYVTILIGANDFCGGNADPDSYGAKVLVAVNKIKEVSPKAKILLSSIPDMIQVRKVAATMQCNFLWKRAMQHCDVSDESKFYASWNAMNAKLKEIAATNENVKYSEALSKAIIDRDALSNIDCFHPSLAAQGKIAAMTWDEGFFK